MTPFIFTFYFYKNNTIKFNICPLFYKKKTAPVCTTELGEVSRRSSDFASRGVKVIGLSANELSDHEKWVDDINEVNNVTLGFPIIADADRKVAKLYDMLDNLDATNVDAKGIPFTVRSVFIVDPKKVIRLIITYPASTGKSLIEIFKSYQKIFNIPFFVLYRP